MKHTHIQSKIRQQGFTLVEVMVSSLLTLMVMGMLFGVLMGTIDAWEGGTSRLRSAGDARLALDILKTDLESMVVRQTQYNQEWLVSEPVLVEGLQSTRLLFFAPAMDRKQDDPGDIVAISYQTALQDPISPGSNFEPIFGLYKGMTDTLVAFNFALGITDLKTFWDNSSNPLQFSWGETMTPVELALDTRGFLAPNVVRFELSWWIRDLQNPSDPLTRFGPEREIRLSNELYVDGNPTPLKGKIEAVEVNLTSISDEGMRRYAFLGGGAAELENIIQEFGRTHTLRIPISY